MRWGEEGGRYLLEKLAEAESHFAAAGFCVRGAGIAGYAFGGVGKSVGLFPKPRMPCEETGLTTAPARQPPPSPS